jgi:hypothetical protein
VLKAVEKMRTNATSRWAKDDYSRTFSRHHTTDDYSSKTATSSQQKLEILRANSPTLKRLLAARVKLERYANSIPRNLSNSRQSIYSTHEIPYQKKFHEKQSSAVSQPVHVPSQPPPPPPPPPPAPALAPAPPPPPPIGKQIKHQSSHGDKPLDKITYEKSWSHNGNMKQKCSLEIWLPKPSLDVDDDDRTTNRTITPEVNKIEKKSQSIPSLKSRRSSLIKVTTTTVKNTESKSVDDITSKKSESITIPRVYRYSDHVMNMSDERPRSSKSVTTVKSDGSIKSVRRYHTRSHTRRQSIATHHSEEILRFGTIEVPTSPKTVSVHIKSPTNSSNRETKTVSIHIKSPKNSPNRETKAISVHIKSPTNSPNRETKSAAKLTNPTMINDLMQKYSLIKKDHQELAQMKYQLEKSKNELKMNSNIIKDQSPRSRPPNVPESTSLVLPDHPTVSVKRLLLDTSPLRSATEQCNPNPRLLERRSMSRKTPRSDVYPHLRIFSLANQRQQRKTSASVPAALLPNVSGKKADETSRIFQRSKTMDVASDIPSSANVKTRTDNIVQRTTNVTSELLTSPISKRFTLTPRYETKSSESITQKNPGQHTHRSTTIPTNTILIHFNHENTERNYLVPK